MLLGKWQASSLQWCTSNLLYGLFRSSIDEDLNQTMVSNVVCYVVNTDILTEKWMLVNPIATYYIMGANVYQSPTIYSVIANRLVS